MASANNEALQRAMKLAAITGLKVALGPALLASAQNRPEKRTLAMAAMGEMVLDKLPILPSRSSLPLLLPRALAGAWVAKTSLEADGVEEAWAAPLGAAVAAGVATFAPMIRKALHGVLGVPDMVIGLAEDYLALKVGGEAVGLNMNELGDVAREAVGEIQERVGPALEDVREKILPAR